MELIMKKYFAETHPQNAKGATAEIGAGDNGKVTITVDKVGTEGNSYTVEVVVAEGNSKAMGAALTGNALVVTLGTGAAGAVDNTKNTAILVAKAIDAIPGLSAVHSGTGATAISEAIAEAEFAGGQLGTPAAAPGMMFVHGDTLYFTIGSNTETQANWRSVSITTP